jgi:hypothetical protein
MYNTKFSRDDLAKEILREAKILGLHAGSVKLIAERVADEVAAWARGRAEITEEDLSRITAQKLSKYNRDLSYVYKTRDKVI